MAEKGSNGSAKKEEVGEKVTVSEVIEDVGTPHETVAEPEVIKGLSLVEEFQAQLADQPDPEADITDGPINLKDEIIGYLKMQDRVYWINITPLLLSLIKSTGLKEIKTAITELVQEKKIVYHANAHEMWGTPSGNDKDQQTTYHTIENLNLYVKLV